MGMLNKVQHFPAAHSIVNTEAMTATWMVHSDVIRKIKNISCQHGIYKYKRRETFSLALVVAASLCYGGEGIGGCSLWLCLWAEISTGPWMVHSDVIEKIRIISC